MTKYRNKKTDQEIDGDIMKFDSIAESARAVFLAAMQRAGNIEGLEYQPEFILCDKFTRNGVNHRSIKYIADFKYTEDGINIIEDVKGMQTGIYKIKKKILLAKYDDFTFRETTLKKGRWQIKDF